MTRPDMHAEAQAAYAAWVQSQDDDDAPTWAELSSAEHDAWRRAVRLLAVVREED